MTAEENTVARLHEVVSPNAVPRSVAGNGGAVVGHHATKRLAMVPLPDANVADLASSSSSSSAATAAAAAPPIPVKKNGPRRKKRKSESFALYIYKVLKDTHPNLGISRKSMDIMNSFILDIFDRLSTEALRLMHISSKKKTLSVRELQTASRLLLPEDLRRHAADEAQKAVASFAAQQLSKVKTSTSTYKPSAMILSMQRPPLGPPRHLPLHPVPQHPVPPQHVPQHVPMVQHQVVSSSSPINPTSSS